MKSMICMTFLLGFALGCDDREAKRSAIAMVGGDPDRGRQVIANAGCISCHIVPGIPGGQTALVGPPLTKMASRTYVGGVLPNTPTNLVRWIQDPPAVDAQTAMPNLHVNASDARDIATYLYTLR
jgi:cytochrome c